MELEDDGELEDDFRNEELQDSQETELFQLPTEWINVLTESQKGLHRDSSLSSVQEGMDFLKEDEGRVTEEVNEEEDLNFTQPSQDDIQKMGINR